MFLRTASFLTFLVSIPCNFYAMQLTPYEIGTLSIASAQKIIEQNQQDNEKHYKEAAALYCQALRAFEQVPLEQRLDTTLHIEQCIKGLNPVSWGLEPGKYPAGTADIPFIEERLEEHLRLRRPNSILINRLPLTILESNSNNSSCVNSPTSASPHSTASSVRSMNSATNIAEAEHSPHSNEERRSPLSSSDRPRSPLTHSRLSRDNSQRKFSTASPENISPQRRAPSTSRSLSKSSGIFNLKALLSSSSSSPLPTNQITATSSSSLTTTTQATASSSSASITRSRSSSSSSVLPPLMLSRPVEDELEIHTPEKISDRFYDWGTNSATEARKVFDDAHTSLRKDTRKKEYVRCCNLFVLPAVQFFMTAHRHGCPFSLAKAEEAADLLDLGKWNLNNYPLGTTPTLIRGIWETIGLQNPSYKNWHQSPAISPRPSEKK